MTFQELCSPTAESGIIATLLHHPEFIYQADSLTPADFADPTNSILFWGVSELAKEDLRQIDAYQLHAILTSSRAAEKHIKSLDLDSIQSMVNLSIYACRTEPKQYQELVKEVQEFRAKRDLYTGAQQLKEQCLVKDSTSKTLGEMAYALAEKHSIMTSRTTPIKLFSEKSQSLWKRILDRQEGKIKSIPLPIPALKPYVSLEKGELVVISGPAKSGKSSFLLTCAVDLLRRGESLIYYDSELSDELFYMRMLAHVSKVPFIKVRDGTGTDEEKERIIKAKEWIESVNLIHEYMPVCDKDVIMSIYRRSKALMPISVVIFDYFKISFASLEAFETSVGLTGLIDFCKGLAGNEGLMMLGGLQTTETGRVSFSTSAVQTLSTLCSLLHKSKDEIEADGKECGNMKLVIPFNRNGPQMNSKDEYIDLEFVGDILTYKQAQKQHEVENPY